jgi:hypothetical protein
MNESESPFSTEYSSTSHASSGQSTDSNERELIAVLRSFRDLIDTVLWRICGDRPEIPESSSSLEESLQQESAASASQYYPEAPLSRESELEAYSEQSDIPPVLQNPDELLRAIEFLVRRGAREWQSDPAASSASAGDSLAASEESTSESFI